MDNDELQDADEHNGHDTDESRPKTYKHRHIRPTSRRWLISPLWLAVCLESLIIAGLVVWITVLEQDSMAHARQEIAFQQAIKTAADEQALLQKEFADYKHIQEQVCLPNMLPVTFDQIMEINKDYVKSAMFMLTGKKDKKYLQYKIVMRNVSQANISPHVEVLFFDASSNQMGVLSLSAKDGGVLEKGEVRSFDGSFEITNLPEPKYIVLKIKADKKPEATVSKPEVAISKPEANAPRPEVTISRPEANGPQ